MSSKILQTNLARPTIIIIIGIVSIKKKEYWKKKNQTICSFKKIVADYKVFLFFSFHLSSKPSNSKMMNIKMHVSLLNNHLINTTNFCYRADANAISWRDLMEKQKHKHFFFTLNENACQSINISDGRVKKRITKLVLFWKIKLLTIIEDTHHIEMMSYYTDLLFIFMILLIIRRKGMTWLNVIKQKTKMFCKWSYLFCNQGCALFCVQFHSIVHWYRVGKAWNGRLDWFAADFICIYTKLLIFMGWIVWVPDKSSCLLWSNRFI